MTTPTNSDDMIDSRDVIARIEELREALADVHAEEAGYEDASDDDYPSGEFDAWLSTSQHDDAEELRTLEALQDQAEGYSDWQHGEILIRDSYFETYAQELAEDIGATKSDLGWPHNCIDWERAARELQQDYTAVDFDGVNYLVRS